MSADWNPKELTEADWSLYREMLEILRQGKADPQKAEMIQERKRQEKAMEAAFREMKEMQRQPERTAPMNRRERREALRNRRKKGRKKSRL